MNKGKYYDGRITQRKGENIRVEYDNGETENTTMAAIRVNPRDNQCATAEASIDIEPLADNPFGVKDVPDPDGDDVKTFAEGVKLSGGADDDNAKVWSDNTVKGTAKTLNGEWSSRWNVGSAGTEWIAGSAEVKSAGDRIYILYKDKTRSYLIDARREKDRLVGRYVRVEQPGDTSPWVGKIVSPERIDGEWSMGAGTCSRKLADK